MEKTCVWKGGGLDPLIELVAEKCLSWVVRDERGNSVVADPLEGELVAAHYAQSHLAAALLLGWQPGSQEFETGASLLRTLLDRWGSDSRLPGFHNDFNNMALCLACERLEAVGLHGDLSARARATVIETPDSNHDTVNWLPMRMLVNAFRLEWTGDAKWGDARSRCERLVARATSPDGFVEDRLPFGKSFNLQYDVATVATLALLRQRGDGRGLGAMTRALLGAVAPDGDINYLGRGCNQVFCWGPWLYLLKSAGERGEYDRALAYLRERLPIMLVNDNLMLNDLPGARRDGWWDYHYCSVYTAHLLLWLVLARDAGAGVFDAPPALPAGAPKTGVLISRTEDSFACVFSGRSEYLAERGPVVSAVWTGGKGMVHKGEFGPWLKPFGMLHSSGPVLLNHFGLMGAGGLLGPGISPVFARVEVREGAGALALTFRTRPGTGACFFNVPLLPGATSDGIEVLADGGALPVRLAGRIPTQYGEKSLLQSRPAKAKTWEVRIPL